MDGELKKVKLKKIPVDRIRPAEWDVQDMKNGKYEGLKERIKVTEGDYLKHVPIRVRPVDDKYEIVEGKYCWKVVKELEFPDAWCEVRDISEKEAMEENVERSQSRGYIDYFKLSKMLNEDYERYSHDMTQKEQGKKLGFEQSTISSIRSIYPNLKKYEKSIDISIFSNAQKEKIGRVNNDRFLDLVVEKTVEDDTSSKDLQNMASTLNKASKYIEEKTDDEEVQNLILDKLISKGRSILNYKKSTFKDKIDKIATSHGKVDESKYREEMEEFLSSLNSQQLADFNMVIKLKRLGWKSQEMVEYFDLEDENIAHKVIEKQSEFEKIIRGEEELLEEEGSDPREVVSEMTNEFNEVWQNKMKGLSDEKISEHWHMDEPLMWGILLQNEDDEDRFKLVGSSEYGYWSETDRKEKGPKTYNNWWFPKPDPLMGRKYEGMVYGQEMMNILYRYTEEENLVVDPMAGSGVIIDTSLIMNRKCRAYDNNPDALKQRSDILSHDITRGFPEEVRFEKPVLVIFDPPHYKKREEVYRTSETITKNKSTFLQFVEDFGRNCFTILKRGGYMALCFSLYIGDLYKSGKKEASVFDQELIKRIRVNDFVQYKFPILASHGPEKYSGAQVKRAKEVNRVLPLSRSWHIFRKELKPGQKTIDFL